MALSKTPIPINFSKGVDLKSDPYQVGLGSFLALSNSVFDTAGRLTKRNGFNSITELPNTTQTTLTTFNDNLIATGSDLYAFSDDTNGWINQGLIQPVQINTQSLVRNSTSQTSPDVAIAPNGLVCLAYMDNGQAYYSITDSASAQQVVRRTALPTGATAPKAFLVGSYFYVTYVAVSTFTLNFVAIPTLNPSAPVDPILISTTSGLLSAAAGYDGYAVNNTLFVAWGAADGTVKVAYVNSALAVSGASTLAASSTICLSITADTSNQRLWISFADTSGLNGYTVAYSYVLTLLTAKTTIFTSAEAVNEITSIAIDGTLHVFYQTAHNYSYTGGGRSDFLSKLTVVPGAGLGAGTVTGPSVMLRSVGLASKAFESTSGTIFMLVAYGCTTQSPATRDSNQPSYYLIDNSGNVYMRLAYSNGGGYAANQVLPNVTVVDGQYCFPYLITDFLTAVNKTTNAPAGTPVNAIYTQTGVNLVRITLDDTQQHSSEIAGALHLTGGQLWEYDGVKPVEHGFHVWPENIAVGGDPTVGGLAVTKTYNYVFTYEWTDNAGNLHRSAPSIPTSITIATPPATFTGLRTSGSASITSVSTFTGLQVGQAITGTGIPANTRIIALNSGAATLTMSNNASSGSATSTTITPAVLTSTSVSVPTLRLTAKITPNPVRIVGYRWSTDQQVYYQFTSVSSPTVNDTTADSVAFTDSATDAAILGNTILYTTGGVIENIAAPAAVHSALFSNRLFLIDAEEPNVLWFSKQVIQNVPVEMSDLLTLYVAPTSGAQGSTGPMTALGAMDDKLIIFKKDAIYYINGNGPDNTGSNSTFSDPVFINSTVGCSNPNSVVLMPNGIMFQSDKGIWLLGRGLDTTYIGAAVEAYNGSTVLSATAIPGTNQVRFVLDSNVTLMYDYFYQQWATHTNIGAISATLYQSQHTYLNSYGRVFQETSGSYTDGSTPVLMSLKTSWINIAGIQGFERFYSGNLLGTYFTPFKLNVTLAYNYNGSASQSIIVSPDNYAPAYGDEAVWGSGGPWGGSEGNVFTARLFPQIQKCSSFQVSIEEMYDPSLGTTPGEGLSLSGLLLLVGMKRGSRTQSAAKSFG